MNGPKHALREGSFASNYHGPLQPNVASTSVVVFMFRRMGKGSGYPSDGQTVMGAHGDARAAANLASGVQSPPSALGSAPIGAP